MLSAHCRRRGRARFCGRSLTFDGTETAASGITLCSTVRRVYLDLNKWIDLGRAINGNPEGQRFRDVALAVCAAVDRGLVSFPLSMGHYFETWKKRSAVQRNELASTMAAVSRNHSIASHWQLLPGELDRALQRRFGRPSSPRLLQPFGWGSRHRSGGFVPTPGQSVRARVLDTTPGLSETELIDVLDRLMLAGPPEDMPVEGVPLPPMQAAEDFARAQNELAKLYAERGVDRDTRRNDLARREFEDIFDPLQIALVRAGISWGEFQALGPDGVTEFMLDLPSRAPGFELMRWQHDNQQTTWKPNDLTDIGYLSVAVGYCDIVVTERRWRHMLNASGAAQCAGTTVISDLADLTEVLVVASKAA